jgi:hypothetical protein
MKSSSHPERLDELDTLVMPGYHGPSKWNRNNPGVINGVNHYRNNQEWVTEKYGSRENYKSWLARNRQDGLDAESQVVQLVSEWMHTLTLTQLELLDKALHSHGIIFNSSPRTRHKIADIVMGILRADVKLRRVIVTQQDVNWHMVPKVTDAVTRIIIFPILPTFQADARTALQEHHIQVMTPTQFIQYLSSLIASQMHVTIGTGYASSMVNSGKREVGSKLIRFNGAIGVLGVPDVTGYHGLQDMTVESKEHYSRLVSGDRCACGQFVNNHPVGCPDLYVPQL